MGRLEAARTADLVNAGLELTEVRPAERRPAAREAAERRANILMLGLDRGK